MDLLVLGKLGVALFHVHEVGDGLKQEIAFDDHVGIERDDVGRAREREGMVEVARLGALVVGTVKVAHAHALCQFAHLGTTVVVTEPHVNLPLVGIAQVVAAVDGAAQQVAGLVVGGDEDVDIRILIRINLGQRMLFYSRDAVVVDDGLHEAKQLDDQQDEIACDGDQAVFQGYREAHAPSEVDEREERAHENEDTRNKWAFQLVCTVDLCAGGMDKIIIGLGLAT